MARRIPTLTGHPVVTALMLDMIRQHASGDLPRDQMEETVQSFLSKVDPDRRIGRRIAANYLAIPARSRMTAFGEYESTARRRMHERSRASFGQVARALAGHVDDVSMPPAPEYPHDTQFSLVYTGLYCRKDTNDRWVFGGPDEPYVLTTAVTIENGDNVTRSERHPVGHSPRHYKGVDSGEWRAGPLAACWAGPRRDVSLVSVVMEHDEGDPDATKEEIEVLVGLAAEAAKLIGADVPRWIRAVIADLISWALGTGDDLVGTVTTILREDALRRYAPTETTRFIGRRQGVVVGTTGFNWEIDEIEDVTDLRHHFAVRHHADGTGDYYATFEVGAYAEPLEPHNARRPRPSADLVIR